MIDKTIIGFGIAGNFAHHLEQAGESKDFINVIVEDESAPKGIFPTYIPNHNTFLKVFPFSNDKIQSLKDKNLQIEPEVGLLCDINYEGEEIKKLTPTHFMAYNDCSIRVEGASKISHKKNWGENSKGISKIHLDIDHFSSNSVMDNFSLISFIKRGEEIIQYGEDSELLGYSYFYEKLQTWIIDKLNNQKDNGPLENLHSLLLQANKPNKLLISIGATRYTDFGENHYLEIGDIIYVIVYNNKKYSYQDIIKLIKEDKNNSSQISILKQEVI